MAEPQCCLNVNTYQQVYECICTISILNIHMNSPWQSQAELVQQDKNIWNGQAQLCHEGYTHKTHFIQDIRHQHCLLIFPNTHS
jgi:hypothetical protein